jgi:hypothetical protein
MAYSDFTLESVAQLLGVTTAEADLFPSLPTIAPPAWLVDLLGKATALAWQTEKARSEFIVAPILLASRELCREPVSIYSGHRFDVDPAKGLVGECDFILSAAPPVPPLRAPIAVVVEAKKNDIELGLAQCVAQMIAARQFNQATGVAFESVYGCVTTGETWQFIRLNGSVAQMERRRYYVDNLTGILGAFQAIFAECRRFLSGAAA